MGGRLSKAAKHPLSYGEVRKIIRIRKTWVQLVRELRPLTDFELRIFTAFPPKSWENTVNRRYGPIISNEKIVGWTSHREGTAFLDRQGKWVADNEPASAKTLILDPLDLVGPAVVTKAARVVVRTGAAVGRSAAVKTAGSAVKKSASVIGSGIVKLSDKALHALIRTALRSAKTPPVVARSLRIGTLSTAETTGLLTAWITTKSVVGQPGAGIGNLLY